VLELLRERPHPVGELVERLGLSQPGTSKHLRVLREAGLVTVRVDAQRRVYELNGGPLEELDAWLEPYRRLWDEHLARLEDHLDRKAAEGWPRPAEGAASTRPRTAATTAEED
jgi:DNA-binding transcriptional ArsR family regulator